MKHFSHPHDLKVTSAPTKDQTPPCFGCKLPLFGTCYSCSGCNFYLHKFCFELPQSAQFDSHSKHTLGLLYPPYIQGPCDDCDESCNGFTYNCTLCNYNVHAHCANLTDPNEAKNIREQYMTMFLAQKIGEIKSLRNELGSMSSAKKVQEKDEGEFEEKLAYIRKMEMENELSRRRQNLYMQQIKQSADSIDFMGQIGSSSKYTYRYY
ncbi:hypothetical protein BUALT_Bualt01G0176400 [Buddleja alternifolia]|uniref:DC1 domain-containing protein n=1 Tax=Buddleja alternifolia TaxID=168488 RepID=A0AAV6YIF5_9LAMI|nr:hypothetical protein BUALT_Bualt01G0176400 [Buddleja alternifolia]